MPLPSSPNQITAGQIQNEFGRKSGSKLWKISDYRRSKTISEVAWPLDDGIPYGAQDTIKFSHFHGKQHNIVIVLSGSQTNRSKILENRTSIASTGYRGTGSGVRKTSKNKVYIIRTIGSAKNTSEINNRNKCALRTQGYQEWYGAPSPNGGKILIIVGDGGGIYGAGGDGGRGGAEEIDGGQGLNGNSALGLEVNVESVTVNSGGIIQAGGGGGGGGGGGREDSGEKLRRAGGGGGGGGAGLPAGDGGGIYRKGEQSEGGNGGGGSLNTGGGGGRGGNNDDEAYGGGGGGGGSFAGGAVGQTNGPGAGGPNDNDSGDAGNAGAGGAGGTGEGGEGQASGGAGGAGGYAITWATGITQPNLNGTNRIKGTVPDDPQGVT